MQYPNVILYAVIAAIILFAAVQLGYILGKRAKR